MPGLESSSYPPGQYVVPPRGNRANPAYPTVAKVVPAATPQTPSLTAPTFAIINIQWAAASAAELQVQVTPSTIGGAAVLGSPMQAAAAATITSEQLTLVVPAGASWQWEQISGAAATVTVSYTPLFGPSNP